MDNEDTQKRAWDYPSATTCEACMEFFSELVCSSSLTTAKRQRQRNSPPSGEDQRELVVLLDAS